MRYAKALLAYANGNGAEDTVYEEAKRIAENFSRLPGLHQALDNPVLPVGRKEELMDKAAGNAAGLSKEMKRFVRLVLEAHREKYLHFMMLSYIDLYRKQKNISVGRVTTACPVSDEIVDHMRKQVEKQTHGTVEFVTRIDPRLEGGFVFEMDSRRLDASVATQMKKIRQQFMDQNRRIV